MGRARAVWLAAGVVAGAVAVAALAISSDPGGTHRHTYLQFNLCGNACNDGGLGVVGELVGAVRARRPFVVTLNEVCENQYTRLRADLGGYHGHFDPTGARCRNGGRYGNAVLVRSAEVDVVGGWDLPNPARDEARRLFCLSTRLPDAARLVVCVTHVSNYPANIAAQVEAVAGHLRRLAADGAVLVGGDFNTNPADARLDPLYRTCDGSGLFHEADSGGCANRSLRNHAVGADVINQDTYGQHKYDYLFLSDGAWSTFAAEAADAGRFSDHAALWATATLRCCVGRLGGR
jgi:endonuclease/exonuclease/phosphatase family metal-dependent hydrolase